MKNCLKPFFLLLMPLMFAFSVTAQDVEYSIVNEQDVVDGSDTYYEADVVIATRMAGSSFTLGSGQLYFNYNTDAFGENVFNAGNVEIINDNSYLLGIDLVNVPNFNVYKTPIMNDNVASRFSVFWEQDRGAGCIATDVNDTPQPLFKIRIKYQSPDEMSGVCFETDDLFTGQTFTACGPFDDCTVLPAADCTNEPGMQIVDDNFTCENIPEPCIVMGIPSVDAMSGGVCQTNLLNWEHLTNDSGEVLVSIDYMGNDLGNVAANLYIEDMPMTVDNSILMQRHYLVNADNIPQSNVRLRIYFTDLEYENMTGSTEVDSSLMVVKYSGADEDDIYNPAAGELTMIPPTMIGEDFNANFVEIEVSDFSEFWLQTPILPIELVDFYAVNKPREVELKWQTASELNSDYYDIQRSNNGTDFDSIGKMQAAGNSSVVQSYTYIDQKPIGGTSYYRLQQFDLDGSSSYTKVVSVNRARNTFSIYPNPAKDNIVIDWSGDLTGELECQLYDVIGQQVLLMNWQIPNNQNITVPINQLPSGIYFVRLTQGEYYATEKFIKE